MHYSCRSKSYSVRLDPDLIHPKTLLAAVFAVFVGVAAWGDDARTWMLAPPPLEVEPLIPPVDPDDILERDPGGALVLPNIRVNDDPGACFDQSAENLCAQNETTLAINPANNDNWVGGANDYGGDNVLDGRAQSSCGVYTSMDAGQTWTHQLLPLQPGFNMAGDPSVAFDQDGNVYYGCMNLERTTPNSIAEYSMFVFRSTDGGLTWENPAEVVSTLSPSGAGLHDKDMIATGIFTDNVYMAWTDGGAIRFAGSDDGGQSFDAPAASDNVIVDDSGFGLGAVIATGLIPGAGDTTASEHVYVAWMDMSANRILFDRSTDGGQNFGTDAVVENNVVEFPEFTIDAGTGPDMRPGIVGEFGEDFGNPDNAFRANNLPSIDVCNNPSSPYFGNIYIVFGDNRFGDGDVFLKWSEDGGETWPGATNTTRVNNDPTANGIDQFFPWVDVDENCKINVAYYDRRDDAPDHLRFHMYLAHSTDGGESFEEFRVTTVPSTNAQFQGAFIGDYLQIAATTAESATFHHQVDRAGILWMDTRDGAQDLYAATILQTNSGTWLNLDVDLVADQPASDIDFIFPGDVSDDFGAIYDGAANPFQDHEISYDAVTDQTLLRFLEPAGGLLQPGEIAHVGFVLEAEAPFVETFWTGSDNIGDIAMLSPEFSYDPDDRIVTVSLCNDRSDGQAISLGLPQAAVVDLPIELEHLNADDLPGELAAQGTALAPLPAPDASLPPGQCYSEQIPGNIAPFQAIVVQAPIFFAAGGRGRTVLFAQKIAKDAREVDIRPRDRFAYIAKLVCGTQANTRDLALARGHYATTINAMNLSRHPARIEKTLVLAIPPGGQTPGRVVPIGRETLPSGRAMATECNDISRRAFGGTLPAPFIDGYVRIVSDQQLDVTGVYTTATLNADGTAEDHSSIELERIPERRLERVQETEPPDLIIDASFSIDAVCKQRRCEIFLDFTVSNIGSGPAGPFEIDIIRPDTNAQLALIQMPAGLPAGGSQGHTPSVNYILAPNDPEEVCIRADMPADAVNETDETNNELCISF